MAAAGDAGSLPGLLRGLAGVLGDIDGDQGWIAALRFGVAGGLAELGDGDGAEPLFRQLLAGNPRHLWAWIGLIELVLGRGDATGALALGREALGHLPQERLLRRKCAEVAQAAEGPEAALVLLCDQPLAAMVEEDLALAIALHRSAGRVVEAEPFCARLVALSPAQAVAHLARIEIGLVAGDAVAACGCAEAALAHHPDHDEILLRAAQAYRLAGDDMRAESLARAVPEASPFAPWGVALRAEIAEAQGAADLARGLWSEALATGHAEVAEVARSRLGSTPPDADTGDALSSLETALAAGDAAVAALLARLQTQGDLPWFVALRLADRLVQVGRLAEAQSLADACALCPWTEGDRRAFALEWLLLAEGPFAALDHVRAGPPVPRRDGEACERLGRILLAAGQAPLAARYLRMAARRWPGDDAILRRTTEAMIASGSAGQVAALLDGAPAEAGLACLVAAALAVGDPSAAVAACAGADGALPLIDLIEAQLLCGDLPGAEASLACLSIDDGPEAEALICRPRATRLGSLLNEARILAALGPDVPADAGGFFLTARAALLRRGPASPDGGAQAEVPGALHLVWRGGMPPPEVAERMVTAWQAATGRDLRLWDLATAGRWIADALGSEAARAFAMAQDAEQRADLLMLAVLSVEGGMVCSAEQVPGGALDTLVLGDGATLFLEGSGGIAMDCMIAPPGHALIRAALEAALAACLSRETEHRWFKTGPGLMTRVIAGSRAEVGSAPLTLQPAGRLRQILHPCRPVGRAMAARIGADLPA
jgi:tetratricopeptide (TPR) repeat protein